MNPNAKKVVWLPFPVSSKARKISPRKLTCSISFEKRFNLTSPHLSNSGWRANSNCATSDVAFPSDGCDFDEISLNCNYYTAKIGSAL